MLRISKVAGLCSAVALLAACDSTSFYSTETVGVREELARFVVEDIEPILGKVVGARGIGFSCKELRKEKRPYLASDVVPIYLQACEDFAEEAIAEDIRRKARSSTKANTPANTDTESDEGNEGGASSQAEYIRVPSLIGMTEKDARLTLNDLNSRFQLAVLSKRADGRIGSAPLTSCLIGGNQPIFEQNPSPGIQARENTTIFVYVDCEDPAAYGY